MDLLITLVIYVIIFASVAWTGFWIIGRGGLPQPVTWLWSGFLLVLLLIFVALLLRGGLPVLHLTS